MDQFSISSWLPLSLWRAQRGPNKKGPWLRREHLSRCGEAYVHVTVQSPPLQLSALLVFFCWQLLGLIPGGTPFSQLNKDVRDVMSATTKRDVKHQVCTKTCKRPQVPTKSKHRKEGKSQRAGEIQRKAPMPEWEDATKEEGFGETRRKHLCRSQKCAWETGKDKGLNKL